MWTREHFFGDCWLENIGYLTNTQHLIKSLYVGTNVEVMVCTDFNFEGACMGITPGWYRHLSIPHHESDHNVVLEVRRRHEPPSCVPNDNQVALFEYGHFVGRCRVFGIGNYSSDETWGWADNHLHSIKVGDNVEYTFCWQSFRGRVCDGPHTVDRREGWLNYNDLDSSSLSLTIRRRDQIQSGGSSSDQSDESTFTVWLGANIPYQGFPWWEGRFPTIGNLDGALTRVANPRNSVWLGFLKPGYGSNDCGNPDAYVLLQPGETMSDDEMIAAFGSEHPTLPVQFLACSGAVGEAGPWGELRFPALPLNITYTEKR
jgi:hypothetical protein